MLVEIPANKAAEFKSALTPLPGVKEVNGDVATTNSAERISIILQADGSEMIVVTFALPTESSAFIRFLKNVRRDGTVARGNVEHRTSDICVVHTGVGAAKCEERLGNFLAGGNAGIVNRERILRWDN